jgi:hypothetical protein
VALDRAGKVERVVSQAAERPLVPVSVASSRSLEMKRLGGSYRTVQHRTRLGRAAPELCKEHDDVETRRSLQRYVTASYRRRRWLGGQLVVAGSANRPRASLMASFTPPACDLGCLSSGKESDAR